MTLDLLTGFTVGLVVGLTAGIILMTIIMASAPDTEEGEENE